MHKFQNLILFQNLSRGVCQRYLCLIDANAAVLLHFELTTQTCPFSEEVFFYYLMRFYNLLHLEQ